MAKYDFIVAFSDDKDNPLKISVNAENFAGSITELDSRLEEDWADREVDHTSILNQDVAEISLDKMAAFDAIIQYANDCGSDIDDTMQMADAYLKGGTFHVTFNHVRVVDDEFWDAYEIIRDVKVPTDSRQDFII